jgi:hypothetical protein
LRKQTKQKQKKDDLAFCLPAESIGITEIEEHMRWRAVLVVDGESINGEEQ